MGVKLAKDSIDIGIVVSDGDKALGFYRDTLGFEHIATTPMAGLGKMERLMCGTTLVKVVVPDRTLPAKAAPGGIQGAYGVRYWTISVTNLDEILKACADGGYNVAVARRTARPGLDIGIVEDPDGNWVEFIEATA
jgi:catechol 2,3-dioxygenase-like lactoylglutathione lyase family enzyme